MNKPPRMPRGPFSLHPTPWEDRRKGALESRVGPSKEYRKEAEAGERPEAVRINKWG